MAEQTQPRPLDLVVTAVATQLMAATESTAVAVSQRVLAELVQYFNVDVSFLRHNDHSIRASRLIAEWPPRPDIPDPDPLGLIYFESADPVFAMSEYEKTPRVSAGVRRSDHRNLGLRQVRRPGVDPG